MDFTIHLWVFIEFMFSRHFITHTLALFQTFSFISYPSIFLLLEEQMIFLRSTWVIILLFLFDGQEKVYIPGPGDLGLIPGLGIPWRREQLPTPVFWPREFHRLYSPWGHKGSDTTERLSHTHQVHKISSQIKVVIIVHLMCKVIG